MPATRSRSKSVQILTAVVRQVSGMAGIGVMAANMSATGVNSLREQATGSSDYLYLRAVLRALQLGKHVRAKNVSVLCPDENVVKLVNRETPIEAGSPLFVTYVRVRALMHTFDSAEVLAVPRSRVDPARKLALAASRMTLRAADAQGNLFSSSRQGQGMPAVGSDSKRRQ